jgi:succinate dehydrogenase/fumarate reductase flavoprotein subunit
MFNEPNGGTLTGDGRAMAYRAGAKLQNVEMPERHIGPKYFTRFGQATWVGVLRDPQGKPVGTFVSQPDRKYGDMIMEVNKQIAEQYTRAGKGPLYMDCTGISNEDYEYMMHWMVHEGNNSLLNYMKEERIDIRKNPIEFSTYPFRLGGQIVANAKSETSLKGLYAAGDEAFGDISAAATFGWISGDNAAKYVPASAGFDMNSVRDEVDKKKQLIAQMRGREDGPDWEETNIALQQIMWDYAGQVRNEDLLQQGIKNLRAVKDKAITTMMARNPHELGRCLEVLNLLDIGELVFLMASDRKETRGLHARPDYPFTNPLLNKFHVVQKSDSGPAINWEELSN